MARRTVRPPGPEGLIVTKAVLSAAGGLAVSNELLAHIIGVSESSVSRMASGAYTLRPGEKSFDLAVLFVRLFQGLDAILHGDETAASEWLQTTNAAFGCPPATFIQSVPGPVHAVGYLEARRAVI